MTSKSEYKYKPSSVSSRIDDLVAADTANDSTTTDAFSWWRKMHNETFKGSDYGFTDKTDITYISSATTINGGTWGKPLNLSYYHYNADQQQEPIPFTDWTTMPNPSLKWDGTTILRYFATADELCGVSKQKYINLSAVTSELKITYDNNTSTLKVADSKTTYLEVGAYPCILVALQAEGGDGGKGAYFYNSNLIGKCLAVAGGGGGGSGGFISMGLNLSEGGTELDMDTMQYVSAPRKISITPLPKTTVRNKCFNIYDNTVSDYFYVTGGAHGTNATAKDADTGIGHNPSATGGAGGAGGNVFRLLGGGDEFARGELCRGSWGKTYIIDAIPGAAGATGATKTSTSGSSGRVNGTRGSAPTRQTYLTSFGMSLTQCVKHGTTAQTIGGLGELWDDTKAPALAGGGGGGASIMADGGSWSKAIGLGAGGYGQSGWTDMSSGSVIAGGSAGLWISYIPSSNW